MTGESFEYAIKKDVRNNPIVREVDEERHREMWRSVGVGAFLVIAFLFSAWQRVELQPPHVDGGKAVAPANENRTVALPRAK